MTLHSLSLIGEHSRPFPLPFGFFNPAPLHGLSLQVLNGCLGYTASGQEEVPRGSLDSEVTAKTFQLFTSFSAFSSSSLCSRLFLSHPPCTLRKIRRLWIAHGLSIQNVQWCSQNLSKHKWLFFHGWDFLAILTARSENLEQFAANILARGFSAATQREREEKAVPTLQHCTDETQE